MNLGCVDERFVLDDSLYATVYEVCFEKEVFRSLVVLGGLLGGYSDYSKSDLRLRTIYAFSVVIGFRLILKPFARMCI